MIAVEFARFLGLPVIRRANLTDIVEAVCGVAAALLAPVWPGAALVLAHVGGAACWWIAAVARVVSAAPAASVGWAPGAVGVAALAAVSISTAVLLLRAGRAPGR